MHFVRQLHLLHDSIDKEKGPDFCDSAAGHAAKWRKQLSDLEWFRDGLNKLMDGLSRNMPVLVEGLSSCLDDFRAQVYTRFEEASQEEGVDPNAAAEGLLKNALPIIEDLIRRADGLQEQLKDSFRKSRKLKRRISIINESLEGAIDELERLEDTPEEVAILLQNALTEAAKLQKEYR